MSLNIYLSEDKIDCVKLNDAFFDLYTNIEDKDIAKLVLKEIDKAERVSDRIFIGRAKELGGLNKSLLSTGTKTLLNVIAHPDKCFDTIECGSNVLRLLPKIKDGNVLLRNTSIYYNSDGECDINCNGRHYSNFYKLLEDLNEND